MTKRRPTDRLAEVAKRRQAEEVEKQLDREARSIEPRIRTGAPGQEIRPMGDHGIPRQSGQVQRR